MDETNHPRRRAAMEYYTTVEASPTQFVVDDYDQHLRSERLPLTIYYLDDCQEDFVLLRQGFRRSGYPVALTYFSSQEKFKEACLQKAPDLAITDMRMPGEDGIAISKWHQANKIKCPIVILSGGKDNTEIPRELDHGVYMFKPFLLDGYVALAELLVQAYGSPIPA